MGYIKQKTIKKLNAFKESMDHLYNAHFINWSGKTEDSKEFYTEVIAKELLGMLSELKSISMISRTKSYNIIAHNRIDINPKSNRHEEIFAKELLNLHDERLGTILNYQIPLKNTQKDKAGKIDLISFNERRNSVHLIELKYDGNKETLLRTVLEIFTYSKIVDSDRLLRDFPEIKSDLGPKIIPTVLMTKECTCFKELEEMVNGKRPKLKELSQELGIEFYSIDIETQQIQYEP